MRLNRRWLQYSLRSFLVLLTALAVWLGVVVRRATEQREAVKALEALGGVVVYDWQIIETQQGWDFVEPGEKSAADHVWLRRTVGDEFFQKVKVVAFSAMENSYDSKIQNSIPYLQKLGTLKAVYV